MQTAERFGNREAQDAHWHSGTHAVLCLVWQVKKLQVLLSRIVEQGKACKNDLAPNIGQVQVEEVVMLRSQLYNIPAPKLQACFRADCGVDQPLVASLACSFVVSKHPTYGKHCSSHLQQVAQQLAADD